MAILEELDTHERTVLLARHLIGRSNLAHLRIADPSISAEHAMISWNGATWEVHDLGSRNGTTLDSRKLQPGERAQLSRGARLGFGAAGAKWSFADDEPPSAAARPFDGGELIFADHHLLALPGAEDPEITIYRDRTGVWVLDRDGEREPIADGREVSAGGRRFILFLPDVVSATWEAGQAAPSLTGATLRFKVSRDEEFIELSVLAQQQKFELGARAHHALLLALARARIRDREEDPRSPDSAIGWVYVDEVARALDMDEMHINVAIYRCRRQLASAGLTRSEEIVERRKPTRQLRLGVARVEIDNI